jgi:glycosyltransferase involved in cell wall biosynthesis
VKHSLSVLFPVKDVQATLIESVHEILDVVADTGSPFEIVIVDDGSTDATSEVAHELAKNYPQIRLVRHAKSQGREAAIHTGLRRSHGDMVVVHEGQHGYRVIDRRHEAPRIASRPGCPNFLSRLKTLTTDE